MSVIAAPAVIDSPERVGTMQVAESPSRGLRVTTDRHTVSAALLGGLLTLTLLAVARGFYDALLRADQPADAIAEFRMMAEQVDDMFRFHPTPYDHDPAGEAPARPLSSELA